MQYQPCQGRTNPFLDVSPEALCRAQPLTDQESVVLSAFHYWDQIPERVRHVLWLHPTYNDAMVHLLPTSATVQEERGVVAFTSSLDGIRSPFHGEYVYTRTQREHFDQLYIDFRWCGPRMPTVQHTLRALFRGYGFLYRDRRNYVCAEVVSEEIAQPFLENSDEVLHGYRSEYFDSLDMLETHFLPIHRDEDY